MSKFRLKESHEFSKRFEELCKKADELGIHIEWVYSNVYPTRVTDTINNKEYELKDNDSGEICYQFPPNLEYKLTFEK